MSEISERLLKAIQNTDLSYGNLADITGFSKSALQRYATGKTDKIPIDVIEAIAKATNVSAKYILGWEEATPKTPTNIIPIDPNTEYVKIPVVGRVAAGMQCLAEMDIIDYELIPANEISSSEDYVYLTIIGDSMYPKIEEGDLALVRCQRSVDSGSIAVVIIDGEDGVVKKIKYGENWIELHSINPMYPVRRFENEDVLRVQVYGLVKEIKRKL